MWRESGGCGERGWMWRVGGGCGREGGGCGRDGGRCGGRMVDVEGVC